MSGDRYTVSAPSALKTFALIARTDCTEIAVFDDFDQIMGEVVRYPAADLYYLNMPADQGGYRFKSILETLAVMNYSIKDTAAIITHVACLNLPPGIYLTERNLLDRLSDNVLEENPCRSGAFVTYYLSEYLNNTYDVESIPLVIEPAMDNEIPPAISVSGWKGVAREPRFNAFSQRVAVDFCARTEFRKNTNSIRVVAAHLGNEISVGAFDNGRIIDANSPQDGEGAFSPTTSGTLPLDSLIDLCYSRKYDMDEMITMISEKSGLSAYLQDASFENVTGEYRSGNKKVIFLVKAMAFKVARDIAARASALTGKIDAVVITGPWGVFDEFVEEIKSRVSWIAPVKICVAESELSMLAQTAVVAYAGNVKILLYGSDRK